MEAGPGKTGKQAKEEVSSLFLVGPLILSFFGVRATYWNKYSR